MAVIGAGSWGSTVASLVADNAPTVLWGRSEAVTEEINAHHTNAAYLDDAALHPALCATSSLADALGSADVVVMAVPSHGFRDVLEQAAPYVRPWIPVVSLTKGLEPESRCRMTEVIGQVLPGHPAGTLAGPNLAREIMSGYADAAVIAMADGRVAQALQEIFHTRLFRVYHSADVIGVEISGALKNVFAIAAGMAAGLDAGDNTTALVIARSLSELTRLGTAMGGDPLTFSGLAGIGNLMATCMSSLSRNHRVGEELAQGHSLQEISRRMNQVAEGVRTSSVVMALADEHGIEMPIVREVYEVVNNGRTPREAFRGLLRRAPGAEMEAG